MATAAARANPAVGPWAQPLAIRRLKAWAAALLVGAAALLAPATAAWAGLPEAYGAMVLHGSPPGSGQADAPEAEFDLRAALARAATEHKRLYIYLGARDCPYCRRYEAFLARHAQALVPEFTQRHYLLVDLRSALLYQADKLFFRTGMQRLGYADFMRALGDERARMLVYPSVWLLGENGRPLMQMPAGTGTFETVPEQLEILDLVQ